LISQKITYHPNTYIIHEVFEYEYNQLITYERYNINEQLEYRKTPIDECHYLNGKLHGTYKAWHSDGQLKYEYMYHNGILHGTHKEWHKNGQLSCEYNYIKGQINGLCKHWYDNGNLFTEKNFLNGKRHGSYKTWYRDKPEQLFFEENYIDGDLQNFKAFDLNGNVISERNFLNEIKQ